MEGPRHGDGCRSLLEREEPTYSRSTPKIEEADVRAALAYVAEVSVRSLVDPTSAA